MAIKGCATVSLTKYTFEKAETKKDFGIVVPANLSWSVHAEKRAEAVIKALYTLKRNISKATLVLRREAHVSHVVPVSNYVSSLWMPNERDLRGVENVQRKAVVWIVRPNGLLQGEIGYLGSFISLIIPRNPRNPFTHQNDEVEYRHGLDEIYVRVRLRKHKNFSN